MFLCTYFIALFILYLFFHNDSFFSFSTSLSLSTLPSTICSFTYLFSFLLIAGWSDGNCESVCHCCSEFQMWYVSSSAEYSLKCFIWQNVLVFFNRIFSFFMRPLVFSSENLPMNWLRLLNALFYSLLWLCYIMQLLDSLYVQLRTFHTIHHLTTQTPHYIKLVFIFYIFNVFLF